MVKIYDTESARDVAKKIYNEFEILSSCSIYGFEMRDSGLKPKGELVLEELKLLDELENCRFVNEKKIIRKHKYRPTSIGGPLAQKIFTWDFKMIDNEPRYTIWRYQ